MKPRNKTTFIDQWMDLSKNLSWTWLKRKTGDNYRACCTVCRSDFDISNMGKSAIVSHEKGKKHIEAVRSSTGNNSKLKLSWVPESTMHGTTTNDTHSVHVVKEGNTHTHTHTHTSVLTPFSPISEVSVCLPMTKSQIPHVAMKP
jgi:hypothetical protein